MENKNFDSAPNSEFGYINSNEFSANPLPNNRFWVAEDFYNDPDKVETLH